MDAGSVRACVLAADGLISLLPSFLALPLLRKDRLSKLSASLADRNIGVCATADELVFPRTICTECAGRLGQVYIVATGEF
jgi:hypothetical protein